MRRKTAVILLILLLAGMLGAGVAAVVWAVHDPPARRLQKREAKRLGLPLSKTVNLPYGRKLDLVLIPAGEFLMGSAPDDPGSEDDERPRHRVRISRPFYIGACEVTRDQFVAVMLREAGHFQKDDLYPVDSVSWEDARTFCEKARNGLRLPTEAEWEYACRAGSKRIFGVGDEPGDVLGWVWDKDTSGGRPHVVGQSRANDWGLHDMLGNVFEWCSDWFAPYDANPPAVAVDPSGPKEGDRKIVRGGAWNSEWESCRCAARSSTNPGNKSFNFGFRVVQDAPLSAASR